MLSAVALATLTCTEVPGCAIAGVIVSSTGSGPVLNCTVEVEMPQP